MNGQYQKVNPNDPKVVQIFWQANIFIWPIRWADSILINRSLLISLRLEHMFDSIFNSIFGWSSSHELKAWIWVRPRTKLWILGRRYAQVRKRPEIFEPVKIQKEKTIIVRIKFLTTADVWTRNTNKEFFIQQKRFSQPPMPFLVVVFYGSFWQW